MRSVPFISIVTACYNEEQNVDEVYRQVRAVVEGLPPRDGEPYTYEHIFIDNASTDRTVESCASICAADKRVKVIVNTRNFGHIRSPFHGLLQAQRRGGHQRRRRPPGPADDDPAFIARWEEGYKVVVAVKTESHENRLMFLVRRHVLPPHRPV